nr:hypothetical protein [uncultured Flavobacterium sp.]
MGEFSKRELEIVDYIVDLVNFEIFSIEQEENDKGKLDYSLCSDDSEKLEVTKKKIIKYKSKINKCNPDIAVYLIEFVKPTPKEYDFYDWRDEITKNFVIGTYQELIEELALIDKDELDKYSFSSIVKSRGYKYKPLKDYIQGVCDINYYSVYKSFLEIPFDVKEKTLSTDNEFILDLVDKDLDIWLKSNENKIDYFYMPMMIEEKADYVIDSYKNYEERNYKYQIAICNSILINHKDEKTIIDFKRKFENKLIELRKQYPIPNVNIETIISDINNAFYRLENFMKGSVSVYERFLFNDAFTVFFNELNKIENITVKNHDLRDGYHYLLSQIDYAHDKSEFKNQDAYENDDFNRDCNEICYLHFYRSLEFGLSNDLDDYKFEMPSIVDIIKAPGNSTPEIINIDLEDKLSVADEDNLYPRIFTSHKAFDKFKKLREEFGNTKQNLSNYSFVYHRMVKDKFIFEDYKQTEFVFFLLAFDINISRIKPKTQLGNNDLRESIYNSLK